MQNSDMPDFGERTDKGAKKEDVSGKPGRMVTHPSLTASVFVSGGATINFISNPLFYMRRSTEAQN